MNLEFTDDPHPRNTYRDMRGMPMFDLGDAAGVMMELRACRQSDGERYIRLSAFDSSHGWESVRLCFIVNRPSNEDGFKLTRTDARGESWSIRRRPMRRTGRTGRGTSSLLE